MYIYLYSVLVVNKIAYLGIDFGFNHGLLGFFNRKNMRINRSSLLFA